MTGGTLAPPLRLLVRASAALAAGNEAAFEAELRRAADGVADPVAVEEALLQSYLFLGFPAAIAALARWRAISGRPAADVDALATPDAVEAWALRGAEVCGRVYGRAYEQLRRNVRRIHPALDRWMVTEGYGKVLGRPGLGLRERELCIVALLAGAGRAPQLHSHLRGALRAGARPDEVTEALEEGLAGRPAETARSARALWKRVRDAGKDG
ncbi:MAG: carboxymuconolactone decarboxylase family protein [Gemmatimonadota bacterium]|nr:carboxymuconolactone decarboxylase family protein [Gemmatimonadota bacterium]